MTSLKTLETNLASAKELVNEEFYSDTWRSTSYLINLLGKIERYCGNLNEDNPEDGYYSANVAVASAVELISGTYSCPTDDERFEAVGKMYDATIIDFIKNHSDDATADLIYLGSLANYVAGMRVHAINAWIEQTAPSEDKFNALKLAKRDEMATEIAIRELSNTLAQSLGA